MAVLSASVLDFLLATEIQIRMMTIETESQFEAMFRMTARLWNRRTRVFELGSAGGEFDELEEIEQRYLYNFDILLGQLSRFKEAVERFCYTESKSERAVAFHLLLRTESTEFYPLLQTVMKNGESRRYWQLCRMMSFIDISALELILKQLFTLRSPHLINPFAEVVGTRGLKSFEFQLIDDLNSGPGGTPNVYVIEALGRLGTLEAKDRLEDILNDQGLAGEAYLLEKTARSLLMLGSDRGLCYLRDIIAQETSANMDITWTLGSYGEKRDVEFFLQRLKKTKNPIWKKKLIEGLAFLGSLRAVPILNFELEDPDPEIREASAASLEILSGEAPEMDSSENREKLLRFWQHWWAETGSHLDIEKRYREGKPFNIRFWLEYLMDPDSSIRQHAHTSLIIYTGQHFPMDPDAFMLDQRQAYRVWEEWFEEQQKYPPGCWFFAGLLCD